MSIFLSCFVCPYADEKISSSDNTRFFISFSSGSPISHGSPSLLSFEALSDLCVHVNDDLANGVFGSNRKNISCKLSSFSVGGEAYWGITLANSNLTNFWYCNGSLGVFYSRVNTDSLLSLIFTYVNSIDSLFENLMNIPGGALYNINDNLASSKRTLASLDAKFENLMNTPGGFLYNINDNLVSSMRTLASLDAKFENLMNTPSGPLYNINDNLSSSYSTLVNMNVTLSSGISNIESTLSIINDKLDNTATSIENTTVNISNNNPAYNVFYVTDENGEEHSITSVAADSLSASGKLLQFLYKLVVDGSLSGVDSAVDGLNDFFFDSAPGSIVEGGSVWD